MDFRQKCLDELASRASHVSSKSALVGLDGFVDKLVTPVAERSGPGPAFTPIPTISAFAERLAAAAGKSANIEFAPKIEKLGGNGPIMANALLGLGLHVRYIGALGHPAIHPVFAELARATDAISIADPGITHAAEFDDGKIMFGTMASLEQVTWERLLETMGEGKLYDALSRPALLAFVNWTMIPHMTRFFTILLDRVLPVLNSLEPRQFFFDLADPTKRSRGDLKNVLLTIGRFQSFGDVTLGLNFSEALQADQVLTGHAPVEPRENDLQKMATRIRQALGVGCVVIHPTDSAACATRDDSWWVPGPYTPKPLTTTGAGDHFNAGFMTGRLLGLTPPSCLATAVATSGHYVRTGRSPSLGDIDLLLREWR